MLHRVTVEDIETIRKFSTDKNFISNEELAEKVGMSDTTIKYWRNKLELKPLRKCRVCNKKIKVNKYCQKHRYRREKAKKILMICPTCKKEFRASRKFVYCSEECRRPIKKCLECNESFKAEKPITKFCSRACGYNWKRKRWLKNHPEKVCKNCKNKFQPPNSNYHEQIFCSIDCRFSYLKKQGDSTRKKRIENQKKIHICPECRKEFIRGSKSKQTYCSVSCRREASKKRIYKTKLHPCKNCGKMTTRPKYCCNKCYNWNPVRKCPECGKEFQKGGKYCKKCGIRRRKNSNYNNSIKKNSLTRTFVKFILMAYYNDRDTYLKIRKLCIKKYGVDWKEHFDKRLPRWKRKLGYTKFDREITDKFDSEDEFKFRLELQTLLDKKR